MRIIELLLYALVSCNLFNLNLNTLQKQKNRLIRVLEFKKQETNNTAIDYYLSELKLLESTMEFYVETYSKVAASRNLEELDRYINANKEGLVKNLQEFVIQLKSNEVKEKKFINSTGLLDDLINDINENVDSIIEKDTFEDSKNTGQVETVIKVNSTSDASSSVLIDSKNNEYVLAKPGNS